MLKVSQNAGTSASNYQNTEVSALSALVLVKGKVVPAETAETDLQKAEGTTLQFYFGLLKLQKLLLIVSQLFAEIFADTYTVSLSGILTDGIKEANEKRI